MQAPAASRAGGIFLTDMSTPRAGPQAVKQVDWEDGFYRSDIGWRAVARLRGEQA
jgi:phosphoribosylamine-glycine ligase